MRERYSYLVFDNRKDTRSPTRRDAHRGADTVDGRDVHDGTTKMSLRRGSETGAHRTKVHEVWLRVIVIFRIKACVNSVKKPIHSQFTLQSTEFVSSTVPVPRYRSVLYR